MKYIFVYFLPGSAGNFLSRCLNLINNSYCWVDHNNPTLLTSLEQKLDLLSYDSVMSKSFEDRDWCEFERKLDHFHVSFSHTQLPTDSYCIFSCHIPDPRHDSLAGQDDMVYKFFIDSSECFDWGLMNGLYKNSWLQIQHFIAGQRLHNDRTYLKINLNNFISSEEKFFCEFYKICDQISHHLTKQEYAAISTLYQQWIKTTLSKENIPDFKKTIGFNM